MLHINFKMVVMLFYFLLLLLIILYLMIDNGKFAENVLIV